MARCVDETGDVVDLEGFARDRKNGPVSRGFGFGVDESLENGIGVAGGGRSSVQLGMWFERDNDEEEANQVRKKRQVPASAR